MKRIHQLYHALKNPLLGIFCALVISVLFIMALGETPYVLVEAFKSTLFTASGLGYTLFFSTPFILTGLSVAVCFRCGLFNIGAEGQLYMGAVSVVLLSSMFPNLPSFVAIPGGILAAAVGGGLWGMIPGILKAKRGTHEVIVTILLNFIGINFVNYLILNPLKNPEAQRVESIFVGEGFHLAKLSHFFGAFGLEWFTNAPVNLSFFLALLLCVAVYLFLFRTTFGFELRSVGFNETASRFAGIQVTKNFIIAFFLAGALSGLVGVNEVMGSVHQVIEGFSPGYGFTGIAVALMARNHPLGIILTGLLFGALHQSASEMEFFSDVVTKEISIVLQGVLIAFVACEYLLDQMKEKGKRKFLWN